MTKPKQALNKLWNGGYFKTHRKTGDIDKICLSKYGCTCSNWTSVIKNTDFLRKQNGLWIQKYNAVSSKNDKDTIFITGKQPWTDRNKKFIDLINSLKGEIKIVDPYYGIDTFQILSNFPKNKLRLITSKLSSSDDSPIFKRELTRFKREFSHIQIRTYAKFYELHDRYIIADNYFVLIGHGLKDIGNKESFLIAIPIDKVGEVKRNLEELFEIRWKKSNIIM